MLSQTTCQSLKWPPAVLAMMLNPVEFGALEGRIANNVSGCEEGATSLPRLPMTVGVAVMLLMLDSSPGGGRAVRVHMFVVLRQ